MGGGGGTLYPQMIRCLLVCLCSHVGHWYWTRPYSKPSDSARLGSAPVAKCNHVNLDSSHAAHSDRVSREGSVSHR